MSNRRSTSCMAVTQGLSCAHYPGRPGEKSIHVRLQVLRNIGGERGEGSRRVSVEGKSWEKRKTFYLRIASNNGLQEGCGI